MPRQTLDYTHRQQLRADALVMASMILVEIGCMGALMIGLVPLMLGTSGHAWWIASLCISGGAGLGLEFAAVFGRSRMAAVIEIVLLAAAAYLVFRAVYLPVAGWEWRVLLVVEMSFGIAIAGHIRWIAVISAWKATRVPG